MRYLSTYFSIYPNKYYRQMSANITTRLNPEQQRAVHAISGPVLVLAGAGSGKTGVITNKIVYLIRECGYKAYHVVALTFTNKAAREMKERASKMLKKSESKGLWVSTFHTLGLRILKEDGHFIGLNKDFSIFDQKDCQEILKEIVKFNDDKEIRQLQSQLSNHKNDILGKEPVDEAIKIATQTYNAHLLALNAVDFDDLIVHCLRLFAEQPEVLAKWQRRIRYLLLDEYQDTNQAQYQLVKYLTGVAEHFTAVGDDDQSIYSWRGAEAENLKLLSEDFPRLEVIKLEQNYRCDRRILSASNALIAHNHHLFEKKLWSQIDNGDPITIYANDTDAEEAQSLVTNLLVHHNRYNTSLNDYAILYRGNYQSRAIEKELRQQRVPYVINGATSFFEHTEVRDLLAYLRLVANPDDQRAFVRIINTPKREIGTTTLQRLSEYAAKRHINFLPACLEVGLSQVMPAAAQQRVYEFAQWIMSLNEKSERGESPTQILDWIIGDTEYEDYIREKDDINGLSEIIQRMLLLDMLENKAEEENRLEAVSLMTLHAAKGLEFPYVFIVGLEEGLLPHNNSMDDENLVEEERRLLYVGMTRAKRKLWMSLAENRKIAGNMTSTTPSRFLDELPHDEIDWIGINEAELSEEEAKAKHEDLLSELFSIVGDVDD